MRRFNFAMAAEETRSTPSGPVSLAQRGAAYFEMSGPAEFIAAAVLLVLMLVIRIVNMARYRFDSDESQHLHVIWGWARGFVQYRDLFDNHMPLFHIMFAPIFGLIGDRATILYVMRFILLPMYFVAAWCTYKIGTVLFSRRAGVWAVILAGLYARYHFISLEFRTDNLWAPLWLLCITVLVTGPLTARRALVAGLLLGLCFGVSMKSILFLFSIGLAGILTLFLMGHQRLGYSWKYLAQCAAAFLISTSIVPVIIMGFFALKGVGREFRYCVFDFNLWARGATNNSSVHKIHFALTLAIAAIIVVYVARNMMRASGNAGLLFRRWFVLMVCTSYFFVHKILWPITNYDNDPPFYPLAAALCSGVLFATLTSTISFKWNQARILRRIPLPAFLALGEIFILITMPPMWKDRTKREANLLRDVLAVLKPGDYVLDCQAETVFRQRCVWSIFETITKSAIKRGLIVDNTPHKCVETHTCVVATPLIKKFPPDTRRFVKRNYLPVTDNLRIAGEELKPSDTNPGRYEFEVTIPASYEIISPNQSVSGTLDGVPYTGARFLAAGAHIFESASTSRNLTLLWAQAADRHFTPRGHHTFHPD